MGPADLHQCSHVTHMYQRARLAGILLRFKISSLAICFLLQQGCGNSQRHFPASVQGTVSFRGEPVQNGVIRFLVEEGTPGAGGLGAIEKGRYEIPIGSGLKSGTYTVSIYGFQSTGRSIKVDDASPVMEEKRQYIPRQYNDEATQLHQLNSGSNSLDFHLE